MIDRVSRRSDARGHIRRTSIVPTLVFCAVFLYWYSPSLANLPFLRSTQSSTNCNMTGSREVIGLFRDLLEVTCSCRMLSAAGACSTAMSSCALWHCALASGDGVICSPLEGGDTYLEHIFRLGVRWWRHLGETI